MLGHAGVPVRAALAVLALATLAACSGGMLHLGHRDQLTLGSPTCDSCLFLIKTLKCEAADVDTQAELVRMLAKDLCPQLPTALQPDCLQLVPQLVPIAMMYLNTVSPKQLCSSVQLCGPSSALDSSAGNSTLRDPGVSCAVCNFLILQVKAQLADPATQKAVIAQAHKACQTFPADYITMCNSYVDIYGAQFFAYIAVVTPETVCEAVGVCVPAAQTSAAPAASLLPPLPPALVATGLRLHAHAVVLRTLRWGPYTDGDFCDTCKLVVLEAESILRDVNTQKELLDYAREACGALTGFQDQCVSYVELYGPLLLNLAAQYLKPELCIRMGYCPQPGLRAGGLLLPSPHWPHEAQ